MMKFVSIKLVRKYKESRLRRNKATADCILLVAYTAHRKP